MALSVAVLVSASMLLLAMAGIPSLLPAPNLHRADQPWRNWLVRMGRLRVASRIPTALLERRLQLAGRPFSIEYILGMKLTQALGSVLALALIGGFTPTSLTAAPITAVASFRFPDIALARKASIRLTRISDQVSELADVLLVMTEGGVSPAVAFRRAADVLPDPLGSELRGVIRRLELGIPWRSAITEVAAHTDVKPLKRLARTLTRSQRLGTSVTSVLRTIADDLRLERRAQAEMAARQAPVKMLFPLVFLILPAFLLLTVGPVVLSTIRSL